MQNAHLMNSLWRLAYAHFFAFHQWLVSRSSLSSGREHGGGSLETTLRNKVHQPTMTSWFRRGTGSSYCNNQT
jgi:hypothetical protein